jgi:hypothetical protein
VSVSPIFKGTGAANKSKKNPKNEIKPQNQKAIQRKSSKVNRNSATVKK